MSKCPKCIKALKTYNTEVKKEMTFNFTATQVMGTVEDPREDLVKKAVTCTIPSIDFKTADFAGGTGVYTKLSDKITFDAFTEAGKYEYTVKESASDPVINAESKYEKLIMSKAEYTMDVYVVEDRLGAFNIEKIIVNKTKDDEGHTATGKVDIGNNTDSNGFNFTNTYVQEAGTGAPDPTRPDPVNPGTGPDDDYTKYGSLNVSKKVVKNVDVASETELNSNEEFDFTAKFEFPTGTNAATLGAVKANNADITIGTDGTYTFKLKHNENMKFTKLPVGTKITVTEAAKANYKGSAEIYLNGVKQDKVTASKYNEKNTAVNAQKLGQKKNTVDVTNRYNNVPTTGIIMNTLPYVLMIALCGAALFGFVAFKRKKVQK